MHHPIMSHRYSLDCEGQGTKQCKQWQLGSTRSLHAAQADLIVQEVWAVVQLSTCWLPLLTDSNRKDGEVWSPEGTRLRYASTGVMRSLKRRSYSGTMLPRWAAALKLSKPGKPGQSSSPHPSARTLHGELSQR